MSQRMVLAVVLLALVCAAPTVALAQARTTVNGSVVTPARPTFAANLVVIAYQNGREVGRTDISLPASNSTTYPFNFSANAQGNLQVRGYIVDQNRRIFFQGQSTNYTPGITLALTGAPGTELLPYGSTGALLVAVGVLAAILAGAINLWRRRRSGVLERRFA